MNNFRQISDSRILQNPDPQPWSLLSFYIYLFIHLFLNLPNNIGTCIYLFNSIYPTGLPKGNQRQGAHEISISYLFCLSVSIWYLTIYRTQQKQHWKYPEGDPAARKTVQGAHYIHILSILYIYFIYQCTYLYSLLNYLWTTYSYLAIQQSSQEIIQLSTGAN